MVNATTPITTRETALIEDEKEPLPQTPRKLEEKVELVVESKKRERSDESANTSKDCILKKAKIETESDKKRALPLEEKIKIIQMRYGAWHGELCEKLWIWEKLVADGAKIIFERKLQACKTWGEITQLIDTGKQIIATRKPDLRTDTKTVVEKLDIEVTKFVEEYQPL